MNIIVLLIKSMNKTKATQHNLHTITNNRKNIMSLNNENSYSTRSIRNGLIAGYTAGITGIVLGHPLESIKVLLQTNGGNIAAASSGGTASIQPPNSQSVIGQRSLRTLYAGVTGPMLTTGILSSFNFAIYDSFRRMLYQQQIIQSNGNNNAPDNTMILYRKPDDYLHYDNLSNTFIAAFAAGGTTSLLTSPISIVKTKQQINVWTFKQSIQETYRSGSLSTKQRPNIFHGIQNFYTGFGFHFFVESFGRGVNMLSYELLKRQLVQAKMLHNNNIDEQHQSRVSSTATDNLSLPERMICAASSGMIAFTVVYPADVIRSRLYAQSLNTQLQTRPTTMDGIHLARKMVEEQGIQSLYRGMSVAVPRAGPIVAVVLPVYDYVLKWLSA